MKMVKAWFKKASDDLRAARVLSDQNNENLDGHVAFWCQQTVEKSIKGYLAFHKIRFGKTHVLENLVQLTKNTDDELKSLNFDLERMTQYATSYRYPDANIEPIAKDELKAALANAQKVYDELITTALPEDFPLKK